MSTRVTVLAASLSACAIVAGLRAIPAPAVAPGMTPTQVPSASPGESLVRTLGCGGCHAGLPTPATAPGRALAAGDGTRDPAALFVYLRDGATAPVVPGAARMPSFHLDDAEALALALYLAAGRMARGDARDRFEEARSAHRGVTAEDGARLFIALNCAACHAHAGAVSYANAPPLMGALERLNDTWLREFLAHPAAVRPFGFLPGTGARMPDFALTAAEADSIVAYLDGGTSSEPRAAAARPISAFRAAKAEALLESKLSCLGCHALQGRGGRIGPELSRAAARLRPGRLRAMIEDPQHALPGTIMPKPMVPRATTDLIIEYLTSIAVAAAPAEAAERGGYLSLIDHTSAPPRRDGDPAARSYAIRCAACHGPTGQGDGFNAPYLRARPAVHASAPAMERRPDDTLYDGIHAGAAILGGSPEMPAFGATLASEEIRGLVRYIRRLCDCVQPAWAGDGGNAGAGS